MTDKNKNTCQNCGYFQQHYIWLESRYHTIDDGLCLHPPRRRHCRSTMPACARWIPQTEAYHTLYDPPKTHFF